MQCPWPFSVKSPSEVTVSDDKLNHPSQASVTSADCKKGRRKEDHVESVILPNKEISTAIDSELSQDILSHIAAVNEEDTDIGGSVSLVVELEKTEDEESTKYKEISNAQYDLDLLDFEPEDDGVDYAHEVVAFEGVADELVEETDNFIENLTIVHEVSIKVVENTTDVEQEIESVVKVEEDDWQVNEQMFPGSFCLPDLLTPLPLTPQTPSPDFAIVPDQVDMSKQDVDNSTDKSRIDEKCGEDLPTCLKIDDAEVKNDLMKGDLCQEESCTPVESIVERKVSSDGENFLGPPSMSDSVSRMSPVQNEMSPIPSLNQPGMLVCLEQLPPGLVPCSPPTAAPLSPEQLARLGLAELCSPQHISKHAASFPSADNGLYLLPSSKNTSDDFASASKTAKSLFDIDDDTGSYTKADIVEFQGVSE